jgi:nucleotide-binding universal stress UspA family protein
MPTFSRILVPTDFSETADEALRYAAVLASRLGARLSLVHVFNASGPQRRAVADDLLMPDLRADILVDIQRRFTEREPIVGHVSVTTRVVSGAPEKAIVEYARDNAIDLIVMGTHGRQGVAHLLLGSVAEHVVRTAPCPVLTVRSARLAPLLSQYPVEACPA